MTMMEKQDKLTTPTLQLYRAFQAGKISYNDFAMLLVRRCKFVAANGRDDKGGGQRATGRRKTA